MTNEFRIIGFLFILLAVSGNVFSQTALQATRQELRVGSFISAELNSGQENWYSVRAAADGILTVETTGNIDTYLEVYDILGNYICENDDGGVSSNARVDIIAAAGAAYQIKLRGYGAGTWGSYLILADMKYFPQMTELQAGTLESGEIEWLQEVWYSFKTAEAGYLIVETLSDNDILPEVYNEYLVLYKDFNYISGELYNRIELEVRPGMTFYFKLKSLNNSASDGGESGEPPDFVSYQIMAGMISYPAPLPLAIGTFQNGFINSGDEFWYSVKTARDGYLIVETTGTTDTYLDAYDELYQLISSNDDNYDINARIRIPVQANQTYIFKLRGYSRGVTGSFRIFAKFE